MVFKERDAIILRASTLNKHEKLLRKAVETLYTVRVLKDRVGRIYSRIEERRAELTKRLLDLEQMGEKYLAKRYAEEIGRINVFMKRLSALQLVLDKVDLAIQHAVMTRDLLNLSVELNQLLREMARIPETKIPDLSVMFAELEESVRELSQLTLSGGLELHYTPPSSSEVFKILEEAREVLRKNLEVG